MNVYVEYGRGPQIVGRDSNSGRETFHTGSRNNLNLHFKFAIIVRQNICNRLLFYVLSFIQFCARKLLLSIVVLKLIFIYDVFSTKLYAHEMCGSGDLEKFHRVARKSICEPLVYSTVAWLRIYCFWHHWCHTNSGNFCRRMLTLFELLGAVFLLFGVGRGRSHISFLALHPG